LELHTPHDSRDRVLVDRLKRNSRHLIAMLDDVLELLGDEFNQFTVSPEMRRLSSAVDEALADVEVNAAARGVDIVNEVAGAAGDPLYWGDERRVRQIVVNLLTNAIKFTASGGRITISCGAKEVVTGVSMAGLGPWTYLRVVDTGRGIPPDRIASIFEPFQQVEPADRGSGAGLGLSISRQFARAMDGEITVSSNVSIGSVFTLWLHTKPPENVSRNARK
jgi:signal transduction histidine kinase